MPGNWERERLRTCLKQSARKETGIENGSDRVLALVRLIRRLRLRLTLTTTQQRSKRRRWIRATHTDSPEMHTHTHTHEHAQTRTHSGFCGFIDRFWIFWPQGLAFLAFFLAHRLWALLNCTSWDDTMTIFAYRYLRLFLLFVFVFGRRQHDDDEGKWGGSTRDRFSC